MPCRICNDFKGIQRKSERGEVVRGTRNHVQAGLHWDQITASAESCCICEMLTCGIRGCLQQHGIKELDIKSFSMFFYYEGQEGSVADTNKEFQFELADGSHFDIELFAIEGPDCPMPSSWETFPTYERTSPRTDSDAAMATIQGWIEDCLGPSHEFCTAPTEAELPTRVVDVGIGNSPIKLVEPCGRVARYICLSHCWGEEQIITTKKSTIKERAAGIKMEDLSKTFQDAVALTRRLGVRYIWIDSLCIVQDDLRDWEVESAKMCDIYTKAYLTIAATHSKDGRGGLFRETLDFEVSGVAPGAGGGDYRVFFRERIDHHLEAQQPIQLGERGHASIAHYPLLTRAWVYQERLLSARVLHFGRYELFFECRSDIACECMGIHFYGSSDAAPMPLTKLVHSDALDSDMPGVEWVEQARHYIARLWRTMVSSYTDLSITKHGDRLPAIGGLAKHMALRRKSAYLAGLWEDTLMDDLLWYCGGRSISKLPRPVPRAVPTWSWASIDDRHIWYTDEIVYWDPEASSDKREPYQHLAKVEEYTVVSGGVDEFGTILQGRLRICGLVAPGVLEREIEMWEGRETAIHHILFPSGAKLKVKADYLLDALGDDQVLPGVEVKCLQMSWMKHGDFKIFMSLVLKPVAGASGVYERIGCIYISIRASASLVDPLEPVYRSAVRQTVVII